MQPEYLPRATADSPTFVEDSEWHPIVDGADYFAELDQQLHDLGAGDSVLIAGLTVDPTIDLCGRRPDEPGYEPLGERLARISAAGATVRVLIAGRVLASSIPLDMLGGFRENVARADRLREWRPAGSTGTPLAGCVLVDFSGSFFGSNHQKVVVVSRGGELRAYVGGIDLELFRYDREPHDRLELHGERWGWHDAAVRLRGPAAGRVWDVLARRWAEAATLPRKVYLRRPPWPQPLNPDRVADTVPPAPHQQPIANPGTAVRVLRTVPNRKFESLLPSRRIEWDGLPAGVHEVFETLSTAIAAARHYVYIEDQYLGEEPGGRRGFQLYPLLRDAAARGVKVIMVGSGIRDPDDAGVHVRPINRSLNRDLQHKIADQLTPAQRVNFAVYRLEHATVHAKLTLVDDRFANIGSANLFSRSMGGIDNELTAAISTSTSLVRDLRVRIWAEHLRAPVSDDLRPALEDLDTALGIWDERWLPPAASPKSWRVADTPAGFEPYESVLRRVDA